MLLIVLIQRIQITTNIPKMPQRTHIKYVATTTYFSKQQQKVQQYDMG
jgi:hypothetical protein